MFLRCTERQKDGKVHRYWSVVENRRLGSGSVTQRTVLYLGETGSISAWIMCWRTERRSSAIGKSAGKICSERSTNCGSTI